MASNVASQSTACFAKLDDALRLVTAMNDLLPTNSTLHSAILPSPPCEAFFDKICNFAEVSRSTRLSSINVDFDAYCVSDENAQFQLQKSLQVLFVSSAVLMDGNGVTAYTSVLLTFLKSLGNPGNHSRRAGPISSGNIPGGFQVSILQAGSTPELKSSSQDWRHRLGDEMSRDAEYRHKSIIRMVGEVCRDLELRCSEAERPLREEQAKCSKMRDELEVLQRDFVELQDQARDRECQANEIEKDRDCLHERLLAKERRHEELSDSFGNLQEQFDQAKKEFGLAKEAATESAREQDLAYFATLTGKDEMFEEQTAELITCGNHVQKLERELAEMKTQETIHLDTIHCDKRVIGELTNTIAEVEKTASFRQVQIEDLTSKEKDLVTTKEAILAMASETSQRSETLIADLRKEIETSKADFYALQQHHNSFATAKAAEIDRLGIMSRVDIEKLQMDLAIQHESATDSLQQRERIIADLRGSNEKLCRQIEANAQVVAGEWPLFASDRSSNVL